MKSSSGEHFIALDQVRALAALLVFSLHFMHGMYGLPIGFDYTPSVFPLALFDEGHTGVALFMTLSGYLFAKLLHGKRISYPAFFWNRLVRIAPLLVLVVVGIGVYRFLANDDFDIYLHMLKWGWLKPTLPNGAWSVTVELHFYLLLPAILVLYRRSWLFLPGILLAAILLRWYLRDVQGEVQTTAYLTLVGRIDQFLLGILAFGFRERIAHRHYFAGLVACAFLLFYWHFDRLGGFVLNPSYPSPSPLWIFIPTLEGLAYGVLISYYDNSYKPSLRGLSGLIGRYGTYSYSIYLLHFFFVYRMAAFIHAHIMDLSNFYVAWAWSLACFALMLPIGHLSYKLVESPFLGWRRRYLLPPPPAHAPGPAGNHTQG